MNYYPLALVLLMAFAGGWVWRGVYDLWRHPKAKVYGTTNMVWETTTRGNPVIVSSADNTEPYAESYVPPRLRAVD